MSEVTIPNSRVFGKNTAALAEFFEKGKQSLAVVFATPEGNFLSPKAVANLLTTAHTEWREQGKREIDGFKKDWEGATLDCNCGRENNCTETIHAAANRILALPFLQPPKDTV